MIWLRLLLFEIQVAICNGAKIWNFIHHENWVKIRTIRYLFLSCFVTVNVEERMKNRKYWTTKFFGLTYSGHESVSINLCTFCLTTAQVVTSVGESCLLSAQKSPQIYDGYLLCMPWSATCFCWVNSYWRGPPEQSSWASGWGAETRRPLMNRKGYHISCVRNLTTTTGDVHASLIEENDLLVHLIISR